MPESLEPLAFYFLVKYTALHEPHIMYKIL